MPPKAKTEPAATTPAPGNTGELCGECEPRPLDPSTTHMSCPHGSWTFEPAPAAEPDAD